TPFGNTESLSWPAHQPYINEADADARECEDFSDGEVEDRFTAEDEGICRVCGAARGGEAYFGGDLEADEAEIEDRFESYDPATDFEDDGRYEADYDSTELGDRFDTEYGGHSRAEVGVEGNFEGDLEKLI